MIRNLFCLLVRLSGLPLLIREVSQRRYVTILTYHRLDPMDADRHFSTLRRMYAPISLQTYLEARRANSLDRLPPKAIIVTIDDGHESVYRLKSVFAKHQVPVSVFLCSGLLGTNRRFWFSAPGLDRLQRQHLKTVPDETRIAELRAIGFEDTAECETRQSLNVNEAQELMPLVDFQSHTVSHPILPRCSDKKATEEIIFSKLQLETQLGLYVNALAYPNGSYTARELQIMRKGGYQCGLTTTPGFNSQRTSPYELKRLTIRDDCGINELIVRSCGLWEFLRSIVRFDAPSGVDASIAAAQPPRGHRSSAPSRPFRWLSNNRNVRS
jgi:peptidoglycan/xylan/chitin deacetylase (PgdA/CDA1 family)